MKSNKPRINWRACRLAVLMLVGAFLGFVAANFVTRLTRVRYGYVEQLSVVYAVLGAVAGLWAELIIRFLTSPKLRITISQLLVAVALLAVTLAGAKMLLNWPGT